MLFLLLAVALLGAGIAGLAGIGVLGWQLLKVRPAFCALAAPILAGGLAMAWVISMATGLLTDRLPHGLLGHSATAAAVLIGPLLAGILLSRAKECGCAHWNWAAVASLLAIVAIGFGEFSGVLGRRARSVYPDVSVEEARFHFSHGYLPGAVACLLLVLVNVAAWRLRRRLREETRSPAGMPPLP